jgi:hypothetical protein
MSATKTVRGPLGWLGARAGTVPWCAPFYRTFTLYPPSPSSNLHSFTSAYNSPCSRFFTRPRSTGPFGEPFPLPVMMRTTAPAPALLPAFEEGPNCGWRLRGAEPVKVQLSRDGRIKQLVARVEDRMATPSPLPHPWPAPPVSRAASPSPGYPAHNNRASPDLKSDVALVEWRPQP